MASITAFAGSVPANYDQYLGPLLFEPYALDLAQRLKNDELQNVLELACGTGRVTKHLVPLIPPDGELIATDINPDMLALAQTIIKGSAVKWQVVNAQEIPFEKESFSHVICQFGVMFFPDKPKAFAEAYRVLKPGGKLLFNVWDHLKHCPRVAIIKKVMDDLFKEDAPDFFQKGPYSFFNQEEIKRMVEESGFQNVKLELVNKTTTLSNVDDVSIGFVDGSPLSSFMDDKPAFMREQLKQKLHQEALAQSDQYGPAVPLQAIVVEAIK